ncbi:hypothetical protein ACQZV8_04370 [Magnetococcales bacterium HHB-1]
MHIYLPLRSAVLLVGVFIIPLLLFPGKSFSNPYYGPGGYPPPYGYPPYYAPPPYWHPQSAPPAAMQAPSPNKRAPSYWPDYRRPPYYPPYAYGGYNRSSYPKASQPSVLSVKKEESVTIPDHLIAEYKQQLGVRPEQESAWKQLVEAVKNVRPDQGYLESPEVKRAYEALYVLLDQEQKKKVDVFRQSIIW